MTSDALIRAYLKTRIDQELFLCRLLQQQGLLDIHPEPAGTSPLLLETEAIVGWMKQRLERFKHKVIGPDKIRQFFIRRALNAEKPSEQVWLQIIRAPHLKQAEYLFSQLTEDQQDMGQLAQKHSIGPEALHCGIVGPVALTELHPQVQQAIVSLQPGHTHPPFLVAGKPSHAKRAPDHGSQLHNTLFHADQFFIVRLLKRELSQLTPELESVLRDRLFDSWLTRQRHLRRNLDATAPHQSMTFAR